MAKKKYKDKYDKLANAPIKQLISSLAISPLTKLYFLGVTAVNKMK